MRFGATFDPWRLSRALRLRVTRVPRHRFEGITKTVNRCDEVAHDHERKRVLNGWFVIGADSAEQVTETISAIGQANGLDSVILPKLEQFYCGLTLDA